MVSIIIPNYNKGALVRQSLDSLLRQTFDNWEAIIVDDCSNDESWQIIQEYTARDERIISVRNLVNKGGNYCRNIGAKMAKGRYLLFLDSDDWLADDCLEMRVNEFERDENNGLGLLVFPMMTTKDGKTGSIWLYGDRRNALVSFLRHEIPWSIMMPIWRRAVFEKVGGFDESFPRLQDVELHTRALLSGLVYRFAERVTPDCFYYIEESRMTTDYEKGLRNFANAVELYVGKMNRLIIESQITKSEKQRLLKALVETQMAAIRNVGDFFQAGKVGEKMRDSLFMHILSLDKHWLVNAYAFFYKLGFNKIRGFNFAYRLLWRMI